MGASAPFDFEKGLIAHFDLRWKLEVKDDLHPSIEIPNGLLDILHPSIQIPNYAPAH